MLSRNIDSFMSDIRLSSTVPAKVTSENEVHELTNMDLAMKLHYLKGVYFFNKSDAIQGLSIHDLKCPMFPLLDIYNTAAGRIRKSETTGRPLIKCNDAGVRIVEAFCEKTIHEWLALEDHCVFQGLCYDQVLGPDLGFSPLVFIQFTFFKCGGMSLGISWAHVLGDALSASAFINTWGQIMSSHVPTKSLHVPSPIKSEFPPSTISNKSSTLKEIDPVGNNWLPPNTTKMGTHSFHVSSKRLEKLKSTICKAKQLSVTKATPFEILSAIIWKSLSRIKETSNLKRVTICTSNYSSRDIENEVPNNGMMFSTCEVDFSIKESEVLKLANLIMEKRVFENDIIKEMVEKNNGQRDFIAFGANLTFVNLEEVDIYGLEMKGEKPAFASYTIDGVGNEGVVLVMCGGPNEGKNGKTVTIVLQVDQLALLKNELKNVWSIA